MGMLKKLTACALIAVLTVSYAADLSTLRGMSKLILSVQEPLDPRKSQSFGTGTGVVLAPGYVLTARHVVEGKGTFNYAGTDYKNQTKAVIVKLSDEEHVDLALLYVPGAKCPCIQLADSSPGVDTPVIHVGFPLYGLVKSQFLNRGYVQGYAGRDNHQMVTNVPVAPGSSGGGIFIETASGYKLVGVVMSVINSSVGPFSTPQLITWMSVSMSTDEIRKFLKGTVVEQ